MFKKLNLPALIIVFALLLAIVVISQVISSHKGERNFRSQLFETDTAKISTIILKTKKAPEELRLERNGKSWSVTVKGKTYAVDPTIPRGMINEAAGMRAERVAATEASEWSKYEVTDSSATHVRIKQGNKVTADFLVGKFSYTQYPQRFSTYIRIMHDDEVYAVNGILGMTFSKTLNDLRNKSLVMVNSNKITRLTFTYPADSSFMLVKEKNSWKINGQDADSAKVGSFVSTLSYTSGNEFVGDDVKSGPLLYALKIEGNDFNAIEVKAYATTDTALHSIITSTVNPDARFSGISADIANRIFKGAKQFKK